MINIEYKTQNGADEQVESKKDRDRRDVPAPPRNIWTKTIEEKRRVDRGDGDGTAAADAGFHVIIDSHGGGGGEARDQVELSLPDPAGRRGDERETPCIDGFDLSRHPISTLTQVTTSRTLDNNTD